MFQDVGPYFMDASHMFVQTLYIQQLMLLVSLLQLQQSSWLRVLKNPQGSQYSRAWDSLFAVKVSQFHIPSLHFNSVTEPAIPSTG